MVASLIACDQFMGRESVAIRVRPGAVSCVPFTLGWSTDGMAIKKKEKW